MHVLLYSVPNATAFALKLVTSKWMPGPIVEHETLTLLTYLPLAAEGLALITA